MGTYIKQFDSPRRIAVQFEKRMLFYDNVKAIALDEHGHFLRFIDDNRQEIVVINYRKVEYYRTDD